MESNISESESPITLDNINEPNSINDNLKNDTINIALTQEHNDIILLYELQNSGNVEINLFNGEGQLVCNLFQGYQNTVQNQISYNCSSLSNGIYFISVKSGKSYSTAKFIK